MCHLRRDSVRDWVVTCFEDPSDACLSYPPGAGPASLVARDGLTTTTEPGRRLSFSRTRSEAIVVLFLLPHSRSFHEKASLCQVGRPWPAFRSSRWPCLAVGQVG